MVENYRRCGKPECHCATVQVHGPYYLLFWSEDGRTCTQHIPRDRVGQVKAMTEHYRRAREALRKIGRYNRRLVLGGGRLKCLGIRIADRPSGMRPRMRGSYPRIIGCSRSTWWSTLAS